ncbi:MAG: hypothetical protein K2G50_01735, partial [Anaeroplasmataceae bacterium]|nr:hypothetical protein [Anaeroplasmataceae bacterium]
VEKVEVNNEETLENNDVNVPVVDSNAAEPAEKDENIVITLLKTFGKYLYGIFLNIVDAFRYNHCLLPGLLILLPGLFIGFFLGVHTKVLFLVKPGEIDLSGVMMFILVLFGCINIFNGVSFISKKNLGTIITSSICSAVIVVCGIFWIQRIFYSSKLIANGTHIITGMDKYPMDKYVIISIIAVLLSILCSLAGCIIAFFTRNKNYKKVKF